jgi:hypothetical protein
MDLWHIIALTTFCLMLITCAGLVYRGEWRYHHWLTAYLVAMIVVNITFQAFSNIYFDRTFWAVKEILYAALRLAILVEMTRRISSLSLTITLFAYLLCILLPKGHSFSDFEVVSVLLLRFSVANSLGFVLLLGIVVWHDIPLDRLDKLVIYGLTWLSLMHAFSHTDWTNRVLHTFASSTRGVSFTTWMDAHSIIGLFMAFNISEIVIFFLWALYAWKPYVSPSPDVDVLRLWHYWRFR